MGFWCGEYVTYSFFENFFYYHYPAVFICTVSIGGGELGGYGCWLVCVKGCWLGLSRLGVGRVVFEGSGGVGLFWISTILCVGGGVGG